VSDPRNKSKPLAVSMEEALRRVQRRSEIKARRTGPRARAQKRIADEAALALVEGREPRRMQIFFWNK
jgi:hypothetical protein